MARQRPPLDLVAACYTAAAQAAESPTNAVRDHFGVAKSTAEGWICQARSAGLLQHVSPGARTARNRKALAVATAMGLEYDAFVRAVQEHADGNLRVSSQATQGRSTRGRTEHAAGPASKPA